MPNLRIGPDTYPDLPGDSTSDEKPTSPSADNTSHSQASERSRGGAWSTISPVHDEDDEPPCNRDDDQPRILSLARADLEDDSAVACTIRLTEPSEETDVHESDSPNVGPPPTNTDVANVAHTARLSIEAQAAREWLPRLHAARFFAACAVVWIHTPRHPQLSATSAWGRFAVPFFLASAVLMIVRGLRRHPQRDFKVFAHARSQRLLLPFVAWSLVYLSFKIAKRLVAPDQPNDLPGWSALCFGTAYHLWFLPYLTLVSLAAFPWTQWVHDQGHRTSAALGALYGGILLAAIPWTRYLPADSPWLFMALATPSACWGWALATTWHDWSHRLPQKGWTLLAGSVFVYCGLVLWFVGRHAALESAAGMAFLVLAMHPEPTGWSDRLERYGELAFGMYLSHLLFLKIAESILHRWTGSPSCFVDGLLYITVVWLSLLLTACLSLSNRTRWLLG